MLPPRNFDAAVPVWKERIRIRIRLRFGRAGAGESQLGSRVAGVPPRAEVGTGVLHHVVGGRPLHQDRRQCPVFWEGAREAGVEGGGVAERFVGRARLVEVTHRVEGALRSPCARARARSEVGARGKSARTSACVTAFGRGDKPVRLRRLRCIPNSALASYLLLASLEAYRPIIVVQCVDGKPTGQPNGF